jgi:hypothetical protein
MRTQSQLQWKQQLRQARADLVRRFARLSPEAKINCCLAQCAIYLQHHSLPHIATPLSFKDMTAYGRWKRRQKHPLFL